jgi:alkylation response protein AidB-like acyl-CoA dehydrogenase
VRFEPTEDQRIVAESAREFAEREIAPGITERESTHAFPRDVVRKLGELGFLGMFIPAEYGGAGFDVLSYILAIEEIARVDASVAVIVSVTNSVACYPIWKFGSWEQKKTVLTELGARPPVPTR